MNSKLKLAVVEFSSFANSWTFADLVFFIICVLFVLETFELSFQEIYGVRAQLALFPHVVAKLFPFLALQFFACFSYF